MFNKNKITLETRENKITKTKSFRKTLFTAIMSMGVLLGCTGMLVGCGEAGPKGDTGATGPAGEQGPQGIQGVAGSSFLTDEGIPGASYGANGDAYLNTDTYDLYKKVDGSWTKIGNIKGLDGESLQGEPGKDGSVWFTGTTTPQPDDGKLGDFYLNINTYELYDKKTTGWDLIGEIKGENGKNGNTWTIGEGVPTLLGNAGDMYLDKTTNIIYQMGATSWEEIGSINGANGQDGQNGLNGQDGQNGKDGKDGLDGSTWHVGADVPSTELGSVGDLYLNTSTNEVLKKTATDTWSVIATLTTTNEITDKFTEEDGKLLYNGQYVTVENKQYLELPSSHTGMIKTENNYTTVHVGTKNLFYNLFQGTTTLNGVTITISGSKISMSGTSTAAGYFDLVNAGAASALDEPNMIVPEGTYTIKTPYTYNDSTADGSHFPGIYVRLNGSSVGISNGLRTKAGISITNETLGKFVLYMEANKTYNFSDVNLLLYLESNPCEDDEIGGDTKTITGDSENYVSGFIWAEDSSKVAVSYSSIKKSQDIGYVRYKNNETEMLEIFSPSQAGYVKYDFTHNIDETLEKNYDVWRIDKSYATDDNFETQYSICAGGEWECALHIDGRDDFSGGIYHGDEKDVSISVFIDNIYIPDISTLTTLTNYTSLKILRNTNLYDPLDHTTIIAEHSVMYDFDSTGVTISQSVTWKGEYKLTSSYLAMFPVKRYESSTSTVSFTDKYFDSKTYKVYDVTEGGKSEYPQTWKNNVRKQTVFGSTSGIYCSLEILECPDIPGALYAQCSPAEAYNKLYFALAGIGDGIDYTTKTNEYWYHVSKYETIVTKI